MTLVAVPNLSEGRERAFIDRAVRAVESAGSRVLDVHTDGHHNRSVLTLVPASTTSLVALASVCLTLDLRAHDGVHPRLGVLDVCPVVPWNEGLEAAVEAARQAGREIAEECDLPVYLYGGAALRVETRELPDLRRGGLSGLTRRARKLPPDFGPSDIDPRLGVVCVGARGPLIAFNVWVRSDPEPARSVARRIREQSSGLPGVRALGLDLGGGWAQVSMNLTDPAVAGIDVVFDEVRRMLKEEGVDVDKTELVGLVEERFAPDPQKEAARLLVQPGRTLESAIALAGGPPGGLPPSR